MGVEIERKFLVANDGWRPAGTGAMLRQGYLSSQPERVVRVRIEDGQGTLTIKGLNRGATRSEWEYPIPPADAAAMLDALCERPLIEKTRYRIRHEGMVWEVDEFHGENAGLIVAEIELEREDQPFARPPWLGEEVTHDPRYYNASLLQHPFRRW
ncbi:adenylate cyclase [Noviherbaspirillum humi]|uniref:Adenylate cyclase n=1 Tax=Noviherbaspirillum humi TaxID=1688639 RepID=A0A239FMX2_9BURK|nr:CYTH domain-containing protein [Noviherbaspirillum humi]SNS58229.1 adenylate cyclase [Noviherbaspirillum humi]